MRTKCQSPGNNLKGPTRGGPLNRERAIEARVVDTKTGAVLVESTSIGEAVTAASHLIGGRAMQVIVQRRVSPRDWHTVATIGDPS